MNYLSLRALFRKAFQATLIPAAFSGCLPDLKGYQAPACEGRFLSTAGISVPVIPDVVELRRIERHSSFVETLSSEGTGCATATELARCQDALQSLQPPSGFASHCIDTCFEYYLATTRGDEVQAITSSDALRAFLGPIDTAQEAMLIAFAEGYSVSCEAMDQGSAHAVGAEWNVIATKGYVCGSGTALTRHYLRVAANGEVRETRPSEVIERGEGSCAI